MKKLVIAVSGASNRGKTTSIKKVKKLLQKKYPDGKLSQSLQPRLRVDILYTFTVGNVKIGIASQGDIPKNLELFFNKLLQESCEIIICACHTKNSATYQFIDGLSRVEYDVKFIDKVGGKTQQERDDSDAQIATAILALIDERL